MPHGSGAGIKRKHTGEHLQKRAFPRPIFTDQRDTLAALHGKIECLVDDLFTVAFARSGQLEHLTAAGRRKGKPELDSFWISLDFNPLDLVQLLQSRLNLTGLVGLVPEAIDELLNTGNLFGLPRRRGV